MTPTPAKAASKTCGLMPAAIARVRKPSRQAVKLAGCGLGAARAIGRFALLQRGWPGAAADGERDDKGGGDGNPAQGTASGSIGAFLPDATAAASQKERLASQASTATGGEITLDTLREGATFASSHPVTAEDVVWSLNRLMTLNLAQASFLKTHGFNAENAAASLAAPDANTVAVTLPKLVGPRIIAQTLGIVGPGSVLDSKLVMENDKDGDMGADWLNTNSAGSGLSRPQ